MKVDKTYKTIFSFLLGYAVTFILLMLIIRYQLRIDAEKAGDFSAIILGPLYLVIGLFYYFIFINLISLFGLWTAKLRRDHDQLIAFRFLVNLTIASTIVSFILLYS